MDISIGEQLSVAEVFEKRYDQFNKDISDDNIIHILLKAHLYIEYELEQLLQNNIEHPEQLKLQKMKFSQKENLIFALGLMPLSEKNVIHHINIIRNDLAHNLDYDLNDSVLDQKIINQLSYKAKKQYQDNLEFYISKYGLGLNGKLRCVLSIVWGELIERRIIPKENWKTLGME